MIRRIKRAIAEAIVTSGFRCAHLTVLVSLIVFLRPSSAISQDDVTTNEIDSLIVRLSATDVPEERADLLLTISKKYLGADCSRSKEYAELSLKVAEDAEYSWGALNAYESIGDNAAICDLNFVKAQRLFSKAFDLAVLEDNRTKQIHLLIKNAFGAFKLERYDPATRYLYQALELAEKEGSYNDIIVIYAFLGEIYIEKGDIAHGLEFLEFVVQSEENSNLKNELPALLTSIGKYHLHKGNKEEAVRFNRMAVEQHTLLNDLRALSYSYAQLGYTFLAFGDFEEAKECGVQGRDLARKSGHSLELIENLELLAATSDSCKDHMAAYAYAVQSHLLKDSLGKLQLNEQANAFESDYKYVIQQREDEKIKNDLITKKLEAEKNTLFIRFAIAALCATFLFLLFLFFRLRVSKRTNLKLEQQKEELQKLSIVAANIEQMVIIVGKNDRIEWVNKAFEKKFGYLRFETINRTPYELLGGEGTDLGEIKRIRGKIFNEKRPFEAVMMQYSKNKTPFYTRMHFTPILSPNNELERYVVVSHDITEDQKVAEELKELSLVASNTTNAIVIFDRDKKAIWSNDSFSRISGLNTGSVLGKTPVDIYNGPLLGGVEKKELLMLYDSHTTFTKECESTNRITNSRFWISMSVTPVFDDQGELVKYINVATDITELKDLEKQYSSLVEGSSDMIYEIDISGIFVFVNDVMTKITGYSKEELTQMHFLELIPTDYKDVVQSFYRDQVWEMRSSSRLEFPALTKSGEQLWVEQRAQIKLSPSGKKVTGFSVVTRDISEQKKAKEALERTYRNTRLLSEIGMQITSTHSVKEIIGKVYGNINQLMAANVFGIGIPDRENKRLVFPKIVEDGKSLENFGFNLSDETRLGVLCFKEGREIIIDNVESQFNDYIPGAEISPPVAGKQPTSTIYLPLVLKGKIIGVITVQSFKENAYEPYQVDLLRSLASFVAIALENANLYETMEEKITERTQEVLQQKEELEVNYFNTRLLSEIGQLVSSTLDLNEIFEELYKKVGMLMEAEIFGVRIYDEKSQVVHYQYEFESGERMEDIIVPMENKNNYSVWCIQNRKEIFINDNESEYSKYVDEIHVAIGKMPHSLIFYPMIVESKMVGVITIQSFKKNAYQLYHLDILKTLASYIGTVIDNAALYDTLETKVKERTLQLQQKNNDITASINYARRLQKGILPGQGFMEQLLPQSFVLFKPKDIVSGDFYWMDRTHSKVLCAVVDCTGHGVPGAMMSIIGRNLLDQAVNEKGMTMPSQILNFLQVGLSVAFGQTGERKMDLSDGMDLGLCSIDLKNNVLEFAGANSSLYLVQEGELIAIKGDRVAISAEYEISNSYTNIEIEIQKGDTFYLTSDGLPDQFGGPKYKKFTYLRMQELFREIHTEEMDKQCALVEKALDDWKKGWDQTDDICVMGIRI